MGASINFCCGLRLSCDLASLFLICFLSCLLDSHLSRCFLLKLTLSLFVKISCKVWVNWHPYSVYKLSLCHFSLILDFLHILLQLLVLLLLKLNLHLKQLLLLSQHLRRHLLALALCSQLLLLLVNLLRKMRKLVGHCHTIVAVNITPMPNHVMRIWKSVVYRLLLLELLLLSLKLLVHLLLLCQFVLKNLIVFSSVLFYLCLSFSVQIRLNRVFKDESLICFRKLSTLVYN